MQSLRRCSNVRSVLHVEEEALEFDVEVGGEVAGELVRDVGDVLRALKQIAAHLQLQRCSR